MKMEDLAGQYDVTLADGRTYKVHLPGTLDENQVGNPDRPEPNRADQQKSEEKAIMTRYTRKYVYEGVVRYARTVNFEILPKQRIFLELERSRKLQVWFNGRKAGVVHTGTMSTPAVYELTGLIGRIPGELVICCDNTYAGWAHDAIVYSSAATDETQTNWNGILGYIRIRKEKRNFISDIRVYPQNGAADILIEINAEENGKGILRLYSEAFADQVEQKIVFYKGITTIRISEVIFAQGVHCWDEYEGYLYDVTAVMDQMEEKKIRFGVRFFEDREGHLVNNGRKIFLRGEVNCCVFPETGHMPMEKAEWEQIFAAYRSYGVNYVRFHSHCPPEAAFEAADEAGMFIQPELSHWDPKTAFEQKESIDYYTMEMQEILRVYANHPSFVMLTFGNELAAGAEGVKQMRRLLRLAKKTDKSRLYAGASNPFYGAHGTDAKSDFYTSSNFYTDMLRGTSAGMEGYINREYPSSAHTYDNVMQKLRKEYAGPVFSFEVGQYEILPDFDELSEFHGVTIPDNLEIFRQNVKRLEFEKLWKKRVEASGELALLCYREEVEAVMRTPGMSGISLLGIQDFPGQGTALVGMMNSHMQSKTYDFALPERFRCFYTQILPMAVLSKYCYVSGSQFKGKICIANYGKTVLSGSLGFRLVQNGECFAEDCFANVISRQGELTQAGEMDLVLPDFVKAVQCELQIVYTCETDEGQNTYKNTYPLWIYPEEQSYSQVSEGEVYVTHTLRETFPLLKQGKRVFLSPSVSSDVFIDSVRGTFSTDFWSVGTFPMQEGYMGCPVNSEHPIFDFFPTQNYCNWQWWIITTGSRAMHVPKEMHPVIAVSSCCERLRNLAFLFECRVGCGKLMVSGLGLYEKQAYPEAKALLKGILAYMNTAKFCPDMEMQAEGLAGILQS